MIQMVTNKIYAFQYLSYVTFDMVQYADSSYLLKFWEKMWELYYTDIMT